MPQLTPYLTDINISREEFDEYYQTILSLLKRIQEEKYKTTTENKEMKYVDLTLKLPDPKKDQKQNKFEFLNQFGVNKN